MWSITVACFKIKAPQLWINKFKLECSDLGINFLLSKPNKYFLFLAEIITLSLNFFNAGNASNIFCFIIFYRPPIFGRSDFSLVDKIRFVQMSRIERAWFENYIKSERVIIMSMKTYLCNKLVHSSVVKHKLKLIVNIFRNKASLEVSFPYTS